MKRETDEENIGVMDALESEMSRAETRSPAVLAMADPFNGFLRSIPATPFVPAVLAACGLPTYLHGLEAAGPKYGLTPRMILAAAGLDVDLDVHLARDRLDDPGVGWAYLDQRRYAPRLHDLVALRDAMVKRSCLSTIEVVLRPIGGAETSHLITGYVHKAYPPVYAALAAHAGFRTAAIVRGVEGGCIPSLSQLSRYFAFTGQGEPRMMRLSPEELGIQRTGRAIDVPERFAERLSASTYGNTDVLAPVAEHALQLGLDALSGTPGSDVRQPGVRGRHCPVPLRHCRQPGGRRRTCEGSHFRRGVIAALPGRLETGRQKKSAGRTGTEHHVGE